MNKLSKKTEQLVQSIVDRARTERVPPSRIVDRAFVHMTEKATLEDAARVGLTSLANDYLHRLRNGGGGVVSTSESDSSVGAPVHQPGKPHPKDWRRLFDRILLATPDGERLLPVHEIQVAELEALVLDFQSKAEAYQRRGCALAEAVTILRHRHIETIGELADRDRAKLATIFTKAWGS